MVFLYPFILAVIIGFLFREKLPGSSVKIQFKGTYIVILAFSSQLIIFNSYWQNNISHELTPIIYQSSIILLFVFVFMNHRLPGIKTSGLGIFFNALAIFTNGGHMPASFHALTITAPEFSKKLVSEGAYYNSEFINELTNFPYLCDIFYTPAWLPLSNVFSIGDVFISIGTFILVLKVMSSQQKPVSN